MTVIEHAVVRNVIAAIRCTREVHDLANSTNAGFYRRLMHRKTLQQHVFSTHFGLDHIRNLKSFAYGHRGKLRT